MTVTAELVEEYSFAAEGMAGMAASAALRRVSSLARFSPTRNAVEAIATLTDMGGRIEAALAAGDRAISNGKHAEAVSRLDEAMAMMDEMARVALVEIGADRMRQGSLG